MLSGMVPANDNQESPTGELLELALLLRPLWGPELVLSLLGCAVVAWVMI